MNLTLHRLFYSTDCTQGVLSCDGSPICLTLEDPWKHNAQGISCIPKGVYKCVRYSSAKYPDTWEVKDVPGRDYILIHKGNTSIDTQGCILTGSKHGALHEKEAVLESGAAFKKLMSLMAGLSTFQLTIKGDY